MRTKKNKMTVTLTFLLGLAALFLGLFVSQHLHGTKSFDPSQFNGTYLASPRTMPSFSLTGIDNKPFTNQSLEGHWTLMFFGFTHCGSVCPTTFAELSKMYTLLEEKAVKNLPQVMMISVDPDRDNLQQLGTFVHAFNPNFYAARGEIKDIQALARELGIAYAKVQNKGSNEPNDYQIEHSGALMLFNPQGQLIAFFTTPHRAALLAKDYSQLQ